MAIWVRSHRYANRMVRVGRLLVVFRGELAELPDWAERERAWMLARMPGMFASTGPRVTPPPEVPAPAPAPEPARVEPEPAPASAPEPEARPARTTRRPR